MPISGETIILGSCEVPLPAASDSREMLTVTAAPEPSCSRAMTDCGEHHQAASAVIVIAICRSRLVALACSRAETECVQLEVLL